MCAVFPLRRCRTGLHSRGLAGECARQIEDIEGSELRPMQAVTMEPAGFVRRIPLMPHEMRERLTPTADMIVLCHLGVPGSMPRNGF